MSFVKVRVKELAADFGVSPKEISEVIGKFGDKPKSYSQVLSDQELNVVFDYMTQKNQIKSLEQVFAVKPAAPKATKAAPKAAAKPAPKKAAEVKEAPAAQADPTTTKGKFEIKRTNDNRYMFNVRAANTQVIASSQIYSSMTACRNGINSVGVNAPIAALEDQTLSSINEEKCPKFQIYLDKGGKYRFNLLAANGQNILACTQGYTQKSSCKNGINSVINNAHSAIVLPSDDE